MARFIKVPMFTQSGFLAINSEMVEKVLFDTGSKGNANVRMYGKGARLIATGYFESKEDALSFIEKNFILFNA